MNSQEIHPVCEFTAVIFWHNSRSHGRALAVLKGHRQNWPQTYDISCFERERNREGLCAASPASLCHAVEHIGPSAPAGIGDGQHAHSPRQRGLSDSRSARPHHSTARFATRPPCLQRSSHHSGMALKSLSLRPSRAQRWRLHGSPPRTPTILQRPSRWHRRHGALQLVRSRVRSHLCPANQTTAPPASATWLQPAERTASSRSKTLAPGTRPSRPQRPSRRPRRHGSLSLSGLGPSGLGDMAPAGRAHGVVSLQDSVAAHQTIAPPAALSPASATWLSL